jgi:hypothetical protein
MNELNAQLEILMEMYGEKFVNDMINKMNEDGTVHTMNAAKKLRYASTASYLTIIGPSYVEQISMGRRAGATPPPPRNLERWVRDKMGENDPKQIRRLSHAVSKAIGNNGFTTGPKGNIGTGTNLFTYVVNKNIAPLSRDVARVLLQSVNEQIRTTIAVNFKSRMGTPIKP